MLWYDYEEEGWTCDCHCGSCSSDQRAQCEEDIINEDIHDEDREP